MKQLFIDTLHLISKRIPSEIYPNLLKRDVISFFYHAVSDDILAHVRSLYPVVPVSVFRETLERLSERFNFISYDLLQGYYLDGVSLPPNAAHLSFDDGFSECFTVVRPILLELGIPCTFFLPIDWLDNGMLYFRHQISLFVHQAGRLFSSEQHEFLHALNQEFDLSLGDLVEFKDWLTAFRTPNDSLLAEVGRLLRLDIPAYLERHQPYLTTTQVQVLHEDGFTIGAHGLTHRKLGFVPKADLETEIVDSCRAVQQITTQPVVPFSFPQSAGNVDRIFLANLIAQHPHIGLLFDTKGIRRDVPFMINRVWAERPLTQERVLHPISEIIASAYQDAWVEEQMSRFRRYTLSRAGH
jgi:peptidoglycan/xylan/chitin deacetylase (PgdA/CDA1 family)